MMASVYDNAAANIPYTCQELGRANSRGLWYGDNPMFFSVPLLLAQLTLISIFTRFLDCLLKPLAQPSIVSQILVSSFYTPPLASI